jgi:hypothetical protein
MRSKPRTPEAKKKACKKTIKPRDTRESERGLSAAINRALDKGGFDGDAFDYSRDDGDYDE